MRAPIASFLLLACVIARADERRVDPWIHADGLIASGGLEAAIAYAERVDAPARLLAYLRSGPPVQAEARVAFTRAQRRYVDNDPAGAVEILREVPVATGSILEGRAWRLRYLCLARLQRWEQAKDAARAYRRAARPLGWARGEADALQCEARALQARFRYAELAQLYRELADVERAPGGSEQGRLLAELNRAGALTELGRVREARVALTAVLAEVRKHDWPALEVGTLQGLAFANWRLADYGEALVALDRAGALLGVGEHKQPLVHNHTLRAAILEELGEFERAQQVYETAQRLLGAGQSPLHADLLGNLGNVSWRRGEFERALEHLEEARDQFRALGDGLREATTCRGTAEVLTSMGRYDEALGFLARAAVGFQDHPVQLAETHAYEATARLAQGDLKGAGKAIDAALALDVGDEDRRTASWIHELRGRLLLEGGHSAGALDAFRQATSILDAVVSGLADEETFRAREQHGRLFALATLAAFRAGEPSGALAALERGRAAALRDAMGSRSALRQAAVPAELLAALRRCEEDLTAASKRLVGARRRGDLKEIEAARAAHDRSIEAHRAIDARLQREAKRLTEIATPTTPATLTMTELRRCIRTHEALVLYSLSERESHALVIDASGSRIVRLGRAGEIRSAAERLHRLLSARDSPEADWQAAMAAVRRLVVAPLALDRGTRRLYVSPDAGLSYLPWPALLAPREVSCVPSGSTLGLLVRQRGSRGAGVLALGDPDYATAAPASATRGWDLTPLPGTRAEVRAIAELAPGSDRVLLGARATETAFRQELGASRRWRAVHLACHGIVDRSRPRRSALALAADDDHDGFLSAPEIFGMGIRCDAVVLSACETGRDRYVAAEGVAGLLRAFMAAGAPRLVVSLWRVDDAATKELMVEFYRQWLLAGKPPARALQDAQARVAAHPDWAHPRFWAAWVLWGIADDPSPE